MSYRDGHHRQNHRGIFNLNRNGAMEALELIKVDVNIKNLEVIGEPFVEMTFRGYAPLLPVRNMDSDEEGKIYITASSFAKQLEPLREKNGGTFEGLKFSVKKASEERTASYEVEELS